MNRKGQMVMVQIMIGIMIFIVAVLFTAPLTDMVTIARDATHLDCAASGLSVGIRMTCIVVDLQVFQYTMLLFALGGAFILGKRTINFVQGG